MSTNARPETADQRLWPSSQTRQVLGLIRRWQRRRSGQPPDQCGEHGSVCPVQAGSGVGAAEHGDLVPQYEEFEFFVEDVRPSSRSSPGVRWKIK
jgi:hypothetical protein